MAFCNQKARISGVYREVRPVRVKPGKRFFRHRPTLFCPLLVCLHPEWFVFVGGLAQETRRPPQATCSAILEIWHFDHVEIEIYICAGRPTLATAPGLEEF